MSVFFVEDFGAAGDGRMDDASAIQAAIDACSGNGGGRVVLQAGKTYYSSSLQLKQNVDFHLEKGAVLRANADIDSYIRPNLLINDPKTALNGNPVTGKPSFVFLYALNQDKVSISGEGTIDANGHSFVKRKNQYYVTGDFYPRPTAIYFEHCNHISFRDFTVCDAPFWTLHPAGCDDVLISQIRILNDLDVANSDGIDPDHCSNVRIMGCHIECADDCICLKTTRGNAEYGPCENIVIADCTLISTSAAIKIGTEGVGHFRNILVHDCVISRSNRGLSIQIRDGGNVENVTYSNIVIETRRFSDEWWGSAEPICITSYDRQEGTPSGTISNVRFFNVTCKGENGVFLSGFEKGRIRDVLFENLQVQLLKTSKWDCGRYDQRPGKDTGIVFRPNSAVYAENAEEITLKNVRVSWGEKRSESFASALECHGVKNLVMDHFSGSAASADYQDIVIQ